MQTIRRAQVLVLFLVAVAAVSAACSSGDPIPIPVATGSLLTVETRGGLCIDGLCGSVIVIERDGRVHEAAKPPNDLGTVPRDVLSVLDGAIRTTDFAVLRSRPFTDQCPTAFDGQEVIYEFGAPTGTERIASCETAIDPGSPLFVAVAAALSSFASLPVTRT